MPEQSAFVENFNKMFAQAKAERADAARQREAQEFQMRLHNTMTPAQLEEIGQRAQAQRAQELFQQESLANERAKTAQAAQFNLFQALGEGYLKPAPPNQLFSPAQAVFQQGQQSFLPVSPAEREKEKLGVTTEASKRAWDLQRTRLREWLGSNPEAFGPDRQKFEAAVLFGPEVAGIDSPTIERQLTSIIREKWATDDPEKKAQLEKQALELLGMHKLIAQSELRPTQPNVSAMRLAEDQKIAGWGSDVYQKVYGDFIRKNNRAPTKNELEEGFNAFLASSDASKEIPSRYRADVRKYLSGTIGVDAPKLSTYDRLMSGELPPQ